MPNEKCQNIKGNTIYIITMESTAAL